MKKVDIEKLNGLKEFYWKNPTCTVSFEDVYEIKRLSNLRRIHKIKQQNRVLADKRNAAYDKMFKLQSESELFACVLLKLVFSISQYSEQIGKNSAKIQRLRTQYQQLKPKTCF